MKLKVLFIGGTGIISSACTKICMERGIDISLLNRGISIRTPPDNVKLIKADIRNPSNVKSAISKLDFDVVVDWIAYTEEHVRNDYELFKGKVEQFIFISSASAYEKPPMILPITESANLYNPYWQYSRDKIACEKYLVDIFHEEGFPITIVRPSHTYDKTLIPIHGQYTAVNRMKKGKKVIIHGDGTSLWTLTHNSDFAKGFFGLLGKTDAIGESFHITSDELLTWNQIYKAFADTLGIKTNFIHIPSNYINIFDDEWGSSLLGDKAHSMIFNNKKIKAMVPDFQATTPFSSGVKRIVDWYEADYSRQVIDTKLDHIMDLIIDRFEASLNR